MRACHSASVMLGRSTFTATFISLLLDWVHPICANFRPNPVLARLWAAMHRGRSFDPRHSICVLRSGSSAPERTLSKPFHLAWFLQGSSAQAWGEAWTGHIGETWQSPELFLDMARALERACFDHILIEASSHVGESFGGSPEIYLKNGIFVPKFDPSVLAALMTQVTSRLGIV